MIRQVVINATELTLTDVSWPGYPPLFELGEYPVIGETDIVESTVLVMQVHFWSPLLRSWVKLVPQRTGEQGVIEVTPADIEEINRGEAQGLPKTEAIRRVLGVMVGL